MQIIPVKVDEKLKLPSLGVSPEICKQANVAMESDRHICIKEIGPDGSTFFNIIDLTQPGKLQKKPISADAAMMHPSRPYFCIRNENTIKVNWNGYVV